MSLGVEVFFFLLALDRCLHSAGDYLLQSNAMAKHKHSSNAYCAYHAVAYGSVYLFPMVYLLGWAGVLVSLVIAISHYLIDRYALAELVPKLRGDAPVPAHVLLKIDQSLHYWANALVFLVAAWAIS